MNAKPVFSWVGGKTRLSKKIIPLIPPHICYAEAFTGGAAIFLKKEPAKVSALNDINGDLINLYRIIQNHLEEFIKQFKWLLTSREMYDKYKKSDNLLLTDIQRAVKFYYLQKMAFGGQVESRSFGISPLAPPRLNILRIEEELSAMHLCLSGVYIENLPWQMFIERYDRDKTFFFCDPPYYKTAGYGVGFGIEEYHDLAKIAQSMKGTMLITVGDGEEMREIFSDKIFKIQTVPITYSCGNNRTQKQKKAKELIITNY